MKLKNSHILLIAISIFLLVSIGSVCASDTAMDADAQLAADGFDSVVSADENPAEDTTPINTTVDSGNVRVNEGDAIEIPVTVKDNESNEISITKDNITVTESNNALNFNYNNSQIIITDKLAAGNHTLVISYLGNANYTNSSTKMILSIVGNYTINTTASVNTEGTKVTVPIGVTNQVDIIAINKEYLKLKLAYKEGNETKTKDLTEFELSNGTIIFNYDLAVETCTLVINYTEEGKLASGNTTINRIRNIKIIPLNTEVEYSIGNFTFQVIDADTNEVIANKAVKVSGNKNGTQITWITPGSGSSYSINTEISLTTDSNGIITINNKNFYPGYYWSSEIHAPIGEYTLTLAGTGNLKGSNTTKINIKKLSIKIVVNPYKEYYKSDKKVVINVTQAETGKPVSGVILHLNMPNTSAKDYYFMTDENGTSLINVSGLVGGTYQMTVSNNDTDNINYASDSANITILKLPAKIITKDVTMYYNTGNTATITVTDANGNALPGVYVFIQLYTGKQSTNYLLQTTSKGSITFAAPLAVGSHKMIVTLADNIYDAPSVTKTITVKKASAKIIAPKTTAYFKQTKYFVVKVINTKNNKPIYGAKVNIKVYISKYRYYSYSGQTGSDGKLSLKINYNPGTYNVVVSGGDSKNFAVKSVSSKIIVYKAPAKIYTAKVTAKKGANKYFKVAVKNTKTKKVIPYVKVKIKVYTGKSYKTYTVKTDAKGIAQLNVKSLKVGTHKVVVTSGTKYCTAKSATSSIKITKK